MRIDTNGGSDFTDYRPIQTSTPAARTDSKPKEVITTDTAPSKAQEIHQAEVMAQKEAEQQVTEQTVIKAIEKANKQFRTYDRRLEFSIHDTTKQIMVKVINTNDDSIIREIPSEKILDMVAHMWEVAGILVDERR